MKDFTVEERKFRNPNVIMNKPIKGDYVSDKSFDEETFSDEEFHGYRKNRERIQSCPLDEQRGPNINLKIHQKRYSNQKEKEFFFAKIKRKKKTELCKNYELYHDCYYKDECCFAHGVDELRENCIFSSYKTKMCKSFQENFVCNFGTRCSYKHNIK
jgi:hypothetical protein